MANTYSFSITTYDFERMLAEALEEFLSTREVLRTNHVLIFAEERLVVQGPVSSEGKMSES